MKFTTTAMTFLTTTTLFESTFAFGFNNNKNNQAPTSKTERVEANMNTRTGGMLDGSMAGDWNFDPLNFAQTEQDLELYREAEIRHARLAMLAAVGWPLSELWNPKLAASFGQPDLTSATDQAPAVLNGNIGNVPPTFFVAALTLGAMIEGHTYLRQKKEGRVAEFIGDIGFDPLNLYPSDPEDQLKRQNAEIQNGRLAMLAITGYAVAEAYQNVGVVEATPQVF